MSIISSEEHFAVFAVLAFLTWFGFSTERTRLGKVTTGVVWTGGLAILFSNVGILPQSAPAYGFIKSYLVPLAIPLFLLKVNLRDIFRDTGKTMIAFLIGTATTLIGTIISLYMFDLGQNESLLGGVFAATYIGGTLNFVASAEALQLKDDVLLSAALAADSIAGKSYLILLAAMPALGFMRRLFPANAEKPIAREQEPEKQDGERPITVFSLTNAITLSVIICAAGYALATLTGMQSYGIMFVTALALIPGTVMPNMVKQTDGAYPLGLICAYLFFAAVGAGADVNSLVTIAPAIIGFAFMIVIIHAALLFPAAHLLKLDLAETITASNACILGPTTAAALAAAKGWHSQVTPGLLTGIFGYSIGTFLGVTLAKLV